MVRRARTKQSSETATKGQQGESSDQIISQAYEIVDVDSLKLHPENPRRGDMAHCCQAEGSLDGWVGRIAGSIRAAEGRAGSRDDRGRQAAVAVAEAGRGLQQAGRDRLGSGMRWRDYATRGAATRSQNSGNRCFGTDVRDVG
jgi:hypothetical protein